MAKEKNIYKLARWEKLREKILRRDRYQCQEAKRYGKTIEANTVHHIFPRDRWPEYEWKSWNLISLSAAAHDEMHLRRSQELSEKGKELLRRTCRKIGMEVPEAYR